MGNALALSLAFEGRECQLYLERMLDVLQARSDTVFMTGRGIADWYVSVDSAPTGG